MKKVWVLYVTHEYPGIERYKSCNAEYIYDNKEMAEDELEIALSIQEYAQLCEEYA